MFYLVALLDMNSKLTVFQNQQISKYEYILYTFTKTNSSPLTNRPKPRRKGFSSPNHHDFQGQAVILVSDRVKPLLPTSSKTTCFCFHHLHMSHVSLPNIFRVSVFCLVCLFGEGPQSQYVWKH